MRTLARFQVGTEQNLTYEGIPAVVVVAHDALLGRELHLHPQRHIGRLEHHREEGLLARKREVDLASAVTRGHRVVGDERKNERCTVKVLGDVFGPFAAWRDAIVVPQTITTPVELIQHLKDLLAIAMRIAHKDVGLGPFVGNWFHGHAPHGD